MSVIYFGFDEEGQFFDFTTVAKQNEFDIFIDSVFICTVVLNDAHQWVQKSGEYLPQELISLIGESIDAAKTC